MSVLQTARRYVAGGLSVIPIRADGSKAPAVSSWREYQSRLPVDSELRAWFGGPERRGLAILGGTVSGGLEVLDFDEADAYHSWRHLVLDALAGDVSGMQGVVVIQTPSGGRHVFYRHAGTQDGNQKLARDDQGHTVIETRGEGGYVLAPGCPPACHPDLGTYDRLRGDLGAVPVIAQDLRGLLLDVARSLSAVPEEVHVSAPRPRVDDGSRPGDVYNARAEWDGLLRRHQWRKVAQRGEAGYWRRPGKEHGISATTNHAGTPYLYVFSTNAHPFEADRAYSLFSAYALLDHGGDFRAAAVALHEQGYVSPPRPPSPDQPRGHTVDETLRRRLAAAGGRTRW